MVYEKPVNMYNFIFTLIISLKILPTQVLPGIFL